MDASSAVSTSGASSSAATSSAGVSTGSTSAGAACSTFAAGSALAFFFGADGVYASVTSSMTAIGALSPLRGPSLVIRV